MDLCLSFHPWIPIIIPSCFVSLQPAFWHGINFLPFCWSPAQWHLGGCSPLYEAGLLLHRETGPCLNIKTFPGMGIPMLMIKWSQGCHIFNTEITILVRQPLYMETVLWNMHLHFIWLFRKMIISLFHMANIIAVDDLVVPEVRESSGMILTWAPSQYKDCLFLVCRFPC